MVTTFRLILQSGEGFGTEYPLEKTELFLGRDMSNDIVVNDPEVSRRHARLVLEGTTYKIEDLGSTNGTFIRGQRLASPVLLRPGETITIGEKVLLRYEMLVADSNATVVVQRGQDQRTQPPQRPVTPRVPLAPPAMPPVVQAPSPYPPTAGYSPTQPAVQKKKSNALIAILIVIALLVVFCIIPWIIIEVTNSYCALFPGIFNMIQAGSCL
ncbi:MAG: FHA domain-containing protein [Chloroflexi bacterium]|nr:FHA domain-containing protein [Chloroflexota bacterium]